MSVTPRAPVAFRCKTCGFLESADHAAECARPHACRVCGSGISFDPKTGAKKLDPENWEVLADATPERLAELGLKAEDVEKHAPWPQGAQSREHAEHLSVAAADGPGTKDRA